MKKIIVGFMVLIMMFAVVACSSPAQTTPSEDSSNAAETPASDDGSSQETTGDVSPSDIKVAWIGKGLNNPWFVHIADLAAREAEALGISMSIDMVTEQVDLDKQVALIEAAIERGDDAIVISATSGEGVIPSIQKARDAGMKIVNFDTRIADPEMYDAFVGCDDYAGAYKAGMFIGEQVQEGEVAIITGALQQSTGVDRRAGFMDAMENFPNITVVSEAGAEWRSDLAVDVMQNILTANPNVKAVFACNDTMATGAVSAIQAAGKQPGDIIVVGMDGTQEVCDYVLEGWVTADVALPTQDEAVMGPRLACALIMNPDYEFDREILYDTPLFSKEFYEGHTDMTIYEYMSQVFPLYGVTTGGY